MTIAGLGYSKYVLNINLEKDLKHYATIARRLLEEEKAPHVTLTSCGKAIFRLLKVSSILSEYLPGLHKVNTIRYGQCRTCQAKG